MEKINTSKKVLIYLSFFIVGIIYGFSYLFYFYKWASITEFPNHSFEDLAILFILILLCFILPFGLMLIFGIVNFVVKRLAKTRYDFVYFKKVYYYFAGVSLIPAFTLFVYTIYKSRLHEVTDYYPDGNKSASVIFENKDRSIVLYKMIYNEKGDITEQFRINNKIHISFKSQDYIEINGERLSYQEIQKANLEKFMFPEIPEKAYEIKLNETYGGFPHLEIDLRVEFLVDKNEINPGNGFSAINENQFSYNGNTYMIKPISENQIKATLTLRNRL